MSPIITTILQGKKMLRILPFSAFLLTSCASSYNIVVSGQGVSDRRAASEFASGKGADILFYDPDSKKIYLSFIWKNKKNVEFIESAHIRKVSERKLPSGMLQYLSCLRTKKCVPAGKTYCEDNFLVNKEYSDINLSEITRELRKSLYPISRISARRANGSTIITVQYYESCRYLHDDAEIFLKELGLR